MAPVLSRPQEISWSLRGLFILAAMLVSSCQVAATRATEECPGTPRQVVGTVYCDNLFSLWVNGEEVATDPISFTPHQAVRVSFEWDGVSDRTYAIQCEDYASESGFEYIDTERPQLGDGALIAAFDDNTLTSAADWRVHTVTFGPTNASLEEGCSAQKLSACMVEDRETPPGWTEADFDDSSWPLATGYSARQAGWGRPPTWSAQEGCCGMTSPHDRSDLGCDRAVTEDQCLAPKAEFAKSAAAFIWAADLERDNRVLFRHTASCTPPVP